MAGVKDKHGGKRNNQTGRPKKVYARVTLSQDELDEKLDKALAKAQTIKDQLIVDCMAKLKIPLNVFKVFYDEHFLPPHFWTSEAEHVKLLNTIDKARLLGPTHPFTHQFLLTLNEQIDV